MSEQLATLALNDLAFPHPEEMDLRRVLVSLRKNDDQMSAFLRSWWTEGIPFAFKRKPGEYERLRHWLAQRFNISARSITVIGSGRLGYSIVPKKQGSPFNPTSDIDVFAVSQELFNKLKKDFERWMSDFSQGAVTPTEAEKKYWTENQRCVPRNLAGGFIDASKIPARPRYADAQRVLDIMSRATGSFAKSTEHGKIHKFTLRVYQNWGAADAQLKVNLSDIINRLDLNGGSL